MIKRNPLKVVFFYRPVSSLLSEGSIRVVGSTQNWSLRPPSASAWTTSKRSQSESPTISCPFDDVIRRPRPDNGDRMQLLVLVPRRKLKLLQRPLAGRATARALPSGVRSLRHSRAHACRPVTLMVSRVTLPPWRNPRCRLQKHAVQKVWRLCCAWSWRHRTDYRQQDTGEGVGST